MATFRLPDLGEGLQEAQIVAWHVNEGDRVKADDPLVSVETDKAVTEVPSPWTGRIERLCAAVGDVVKVGAPVVEYAGEAGPAPQPSARPAGAPAPAPVRPSAPSGVRAMPAVRLLARELGIELATLKGSGPEGAILVRDVAAAFKGSMPAKGPAPAHAPLSGYERLTGPRRSMAANMARSHAEVVPATVHEEASLGAWKERGDLTLRLLRAMAAGIRKEPVFNSWFDQQHGLKRHDAINIGIAVDAPDGLLVPVLTDVENRKPAEIRAELDRLVAAAKDRSLVSHELRGATITLSNYGMIGGLHATPVVIPPQVAILGAGRLSTRVVAEKSKPAVRPMLPLSLTYDHRAITGGEAARFLMAVVADLERPD